MASIRTKVSGPIPLFSGPKIGPIGLPLEQNNYSSLHTEKVIKNDGSFEFHDMGGKDHPHFADEDEGVAKAKATLLDQNEERLYLRSAINSGLRKCVEKFLEKTGEIFAFVVWSLIVILLLTTIFKHQLSVEFIKTIKELILFS